MAKQRKNKPSDLEIKNVTSVIPGSDRLTNLMALLVVKGEPQADQIRTLAAAGFGNSEIAGLLGLTSNAVNVALHRIRHKK